MSSSKPPAPQRIAKLLARAGIASRREIERMIEARRVAIRGVAIDTPATLLTSLHDVTVDGEPVQAAAPARLFLYHKPPGLLVTEHDPKGRPTIYDRLPRDLPRVVPVGRLDLNTEGLLMLTTDGELKRALELPSSGVERIYRARAYGQVSQARLEELIDGIEVDGVRYGPINANLERRTGANVWIEMKLAEGKNREVRRVLEYLGLQVSRLIRLAYGPFILADLPVGEVGEVRQHDLVAFRRSLETPASRRAVMDDVASAPRVSRKPDAPKTTREPEKPFRAPAEKKKPVRKFRPDTNLETRRPKDDAPAPGGRSNRQRSRPGEAVRHGPAAPIAAAPNDRLARPESPAATSRPQRPRRPRPKPTRK